MTARKHLSVLLALLAACTACTAEHDGRPSAAPRLSAPPSAEQESLTKVRTVLDGRTIELQDGTRARVSLLAAPTSCAAGAALEFATKTLLGKEVRVNSITPGEVSLALADGTDYALLAVREGVLRTQGVDGGPLTVAESAAAQEKLGLWAQDCSTSTPPSPSVAPTSETPTSEAPPPPPPPCAVTYKVNTEWPGAFQAEVIVRNTSDALINGWTLRWRFTDGQKVTQMWNATVAQNGGDVSVVNADYTALLVPGGTVSLGFNGAASGENSTPSGFTLNGVACARS